MDTQIIKLEPQDESDNEIEDAVTSINNELETNDKLENITIIPQIMTANQIEVDIKNMTKAPVSVFIKSEPVDYEYESVENVTVKVEPIFYGSADKQADGPSDEEEQALDLSKPAPPAKKKKIQTGKKKKRIADKEYVPKNAKKTKNLTTIQKKNPRIVNVKPTFTRPRKVPGTQELYPDSILKHVDIVTISEEERLIEHRGIWHSRKHMTHTCQNCAVGYVVKDAYDAHMKLHSPEFGDYECDLCHVRAKSKDSLYRHKLRHFRRYRCRLCYALYREKATAACHVNTEHAHQAFLCQQCGKGFKRPQYLQKHIAQIHTKSEIFECPICKQVVYEKSRYRSHVRTHSEEVKKQTKKPIVICDYCSREFKTKANLKRHLLTHVNTPVTCKMCFYKCNNADVLRVHYRRKHSEKEVEICETERQCPHCYRVCASAPLLRHHLRRMHMDRTKKYQCDHCKRFYLTKGEVRSHILWSHARGPGGGGGGHACPCGRVFRTPALLRAHHARHHLRLQLPRDHVCKHCGKAFTNKQVLKRHMKSHSDETYPCGECGVTFKTESYVDTHYKLKHLNMTRAEIKAQVKPKLLHMVHGQVVARKMKKPKKSKKYKNIEFSDVQVKVELQCDSDNYME